MTPNKIASSVLLGLALSATSNAAVTLSSVEDTYLSNDSNAGPTVVHGTKTGMEVRRYETVRVRVPLFSFDISSVSGDLSGAYLSITFSDINRDRNLLIIGATDGDANEIWDESNTSWSNAPIVDQSAGIAVHAFDAGATITLTSINTSGLYAVEPVTINFPVDAALDGFVSADTNDYLTFLLTQGGSDSAQYFFMGTHEGGNGPTITFPNAVPEPSIALLGGLGLLGLIRRRRA